MVWDILAFHSLLSSLPLAISWDWNEPVQVLEENTGELYNLENEFLTRSQKSRSSKGKIIKFDYIKNKKYAKTTKYNVRKQMRSWEKIFATSIMKD